MDEDQSARRVAQKYLKVVDADYYEFESKKNLKNHHNFNLFLVIISNILFIFLAHIFFDDAYEISDACDDWQQINQFVKLFVGKYYRTIFS